MSPAQAKSQQTPLQNHGIREANRKTLVTSPCPLPHHAGSCRPVPMKAPRCVRPTDFASRAPPLRRDTARIRENVLLAKAWGDALAFSPRRLEEASHRDKVREFMCERSLTRSKTAPRMASPNKGRDRVGARTGTRSPGCAVGF